MGLIILLRVPATLALSRRMMNSKPSFEMRVTYADGSEGILEILWGNGLIDKRSEVTNRNAETS